MTGFLTGMYDKQRSINQAKTYEIMLIGQDYDHFIIVRNPYTNMQPYAACITNVLIYKLRIYEEGIK